MGLGLVNAAIDVTARLAIDHAPARLFVAMSAVPLDEDPQPTYWRGREAMAAVLGKTGDAGARAANRALRSLSDAGLVEQTGAPAPGGRNARYALLDGEGRPLRPGAGLTVERAPLPTVEPAKPRTESAPPVDRSNPPYARATDARPDEGRTCTRHATYAHAEPCAACGRDRKAAEEAQRREQAARGPARRNGMSPANGDCESAGRQHRWIGETCNFCTVRRADYTAARPPLRLLQEAS